VPDDERITFPDQKVIDLNMSDTELSDVVRPVGDTLQNGESRSIESVSTPESALTLETLYGFRDQFPGGREAFSDAVEKWAYGNEGAHAIPSAAQVRYFTNVHWVDPYQALSDHKKGKSVAEILAIHTSRAGSAHSLEDLKITREGFNVWANLLTQFKLNHPTVDIHALSFAEATDMLFAADRLTQSTNV
jgi:hypothetical protein